ncbi:MAG: class I SAM-dependent methyltransferase [Bacteroidetes bacterium]|nr:class I SAM-dependent methyltransferase [Bacteroidota bacterium]
MDSHQDIISPLTKLANTELVNQIPSSLIVNKYRDELQLDVKRFFTTEMVQIYLCKDSGFKFYHPFNIDGDEKLYQDLQRANRQYYRTWNWENETTYRFIKKSDKILEIGCGSGSFLDRLKQDEINATGLELNKDAVQLCISKGLNVFNDSLEHHNITNSGLYDMVCSFQVLEHIADPAEYIQNCIFATKNGGKIVFAVPNNNPYLFRRDIYHTLNLPPHHMGLWSEDAFLSLPKFFPIRLIGVYIEPLYEKREYMNIFLKYSHVYFLRFITNRLPEKIISTLAKVNHWKGRNILAIFEKNTF